MRKGCIPNKRLAFKEAGKAVNTASRLLSAAIPETLGPHLIRVLIALLRTGSMVLALAFG